MAEQFVWIPTGEKARLAGALIGLARAAEGNEDLLTEDTGALLMRALLAAASETDPEVLDRLIDLVHAEKNRIVPDCALCADPCGRTRDYDMQELLQEREEIRSLKAAILSQLQQIAGFGCPGNTAAFVRKGLVFVGMEDASPNQLQRVAAEAEELKTALHGA